MAANTDKLRKKKSLFSTTLNGGISDSDTTIALSSASGLPTDTAVTLTIDRVDANANSTPSLRERITGVVSSNNVTNSLRGQDGSSAQAHNSGAVVEDIWEAETWNDLIDALLVEHDQDGTHGTVTAASVTSAGVVTGSHFDLAASGAVRDANDNELIKFTQTASAVNEITVKNNTTGNNPSVEASGGDSNISLDLKGKGTGTVRKPVSAVMQVLAPTTDWATGDGKFYFTIPPELNGMVISAVHARAITAGTTGTSDIQLHNVTDAVDILSTKLTLDSGEAGSDTAATPAVINTSNDDVATNDVIRVDIDAISTTPPKGLILRITFGF